MLPVLHDIIIFDMISLIKFKGRKFVKHFEFCNAVCVFELCWNRMSNHGMSDHMKNMERKISQDFLLQFKTSGKRILKKRTFNMFISFVHKSLTFGTTLKSQEIRQRYIMSLCDCGAANN